MVARAALAAFVVFVGLALGFGLALALAPVLPAALGWCPGWLVLPLLVLPISGGLAAWGRGGAARTRAFEKLPQGSPFFVAITITIASIIIACACLLFSGFLSAYVPGLGAGLPVVLAALAPVLPVLSPSNDPVYTVFTTSGLVQSWLRALDARALAPATLANYSRWGARLARRFPSLSAADFPEAVEVASASLRRQSYSATTIHGFQCAMASLAGEVFSWDADRRRALITAKPSRPVHNVPDIHQVKALLQALPKQFATLAALCFCCGLRVSEAAQITLTNINLQTNMLAVKQSKGAKGRLVPIPDELVPDLQHQVARAFAVCEQDLTNEAIYAPLTGRDYTRRASTSRNPGDWPLFPQSRLVPASLGRGHIRVFIHTSRVERAFASARARTRSQAHITPHRLRDAYAVHSLLAGVPVNVIQQRMGHASLETTAKYLSFLLTDHGRDLFSGIGLFSNQQSA
jgi:integrase